jgi:Excalibur calcium-binding domain
MMSAAVKVLAVAAVAAVAVAFGPAAVSAGGALPRKYPNCKSMNARYPHGVGRVGARDRTKSGDPVTNFRRDNRLYERNRHLDRDRDRIACEKL